MGIFSTDLSARSLFTLYACRLTFRDRVMGGIGRHPAAIEGWLRAKAGIEAREEILHGMLRTLSEMGVPIHEGMSFDDAIAASKQVAANERTQGFKSDPKLGLYVEARQVKAMLKESINILYAGQRVGATKKGPKSFAAERVFVSPQRIFLQRHDPKADVTSPDGVELVVGHVTGPAGPRSTLGYNEYVIRPTIDFTVMVAEDSIPHEWWPRLWTLAEMNGLGALRSQGHGCFDITRWDKLGVPSAEQFEQIVRDDALKLIDQPLPARPQPVQANGAVSKVEVRKSRPSVLATTAE